MERHKRYSELLVVIRSKSSDTAARKAAVKELAGHPEIMNMLADLPGRFPSWRFAYVPSADGLMEMAMFRMEELVRRGKRMSGVRRTVRRIVKGVPAILRRSMDSNDPAHERDAVDRKASEYARLVRDARERQEPTDDASLASKLGTSQKRITEMRRAYELRRAHGCDYLDNIVLDPVTKIGAFSASDRWMDADDQELRRRRGTEGELYETDAA